MLDLHTDYSYCYSFWKDRRWQRCNRNLYPPLSNSVLSFIFTFTRSWQTLDRNENISHRYVWTCSRKYVMCNHINNCLIIFNMKLFSYMTFFTWSTTHCPPCDPPPRCKYFILYNITRQNVTITVKNMMSVYWKNLEKIAHEQFLQQSAQVFACS